jgi:hypothetical protein
MASFKLAATGSRRHNTHGDCRRTSTGSKDTGIAEVQGMSDDQKKQRSDADAELEREIRKERKFTLTEAIGRMAGPGAMKGESDAAKQSDLQSSPGVHQVKGSDLLLDNFDQPLAVLASYCQRILSSDYRLQELVRAADIEWGRLFGERPYFEKAGTAADPNDPYTVESVRKTLSGLVEQLAVGEG